MKEKRHIIKKIIERTKNRFNASVAEVEKNDLKQSAVIGFVVLGNNNSFVNSTMDKIINLVEEMCLADLVETEIEIIAI